MAIEVTPGSMETNELAEHRGIVLQETDVTAQAKDDACVVSLELIGEVFEREVAKPLNEDEGIGSAVAAEVEDAEVKLMELERRVCESDWMWHIVSRSAVVDGVHAIVFICIEERRVFGGTQHRSRLDEDTAHKAGIVVESAWEGVTIGAKTK